MCVVVLALVLVASVGLAAESGDDQPRYILLVPEPETPEEMEWRSQLDHVPIHIVGSWQDLEESLSENTCAVGYHTTAFPMVDQERIRDLYEDGKVVFETGIGTLNEIVGDRLSLGRGNGGTLQYYRSTSVGAATVLSATSLFNTLARTCADETVRPSVTAPSIRVPASDAQLTRPIIWQPTTSVKWEYRVIASTGPEVMELLEMASESELTQPDLTQRFYEALETVLNELGDEGWELVSSGDAVFVFRRPTIW